LIPLPLSPLSLPPGWRCLPAPCHVQGTYSRISSYLHLCLAIYIHVSTLCADCYAFLHMNEENMCSIVQFRETRLKNPKMPVLAGMLCNSECPTQPCGFADPELRDSSCRNHKKRVVYEKSTDGPLLSNHFQCSRSLAILSCVEMLQRACLLDA